MAGLGRHLLGAAAVVLAGAGLARAQYAPSIPFAPYAAPYQAFSYPTVTNPSLPNQARLQAFGPGMGGGVSMDLPSTPDLFSMDPYGTLGRPAGGRFMPYHAAFRTPNRFDSKYVQRDQEFAENQARRDELYFQLRSEQDPARREELTKELAEVDEALRKEGASSRRTAATSRASGTAATAPAPNRRTSRGTPVAVPNLPVAGPNGMRRAETGRSAAPTTPPAAGATSRVTGEKPAGRGTPLTVPAAEPAATPNSDSADAADDVDPNEVLERSRRLDSASGLGLPPLGSGGSGSSAGIGGARTSGRTTSVFSGRSGSGAFGGGGNGGAFSSLPKPSSGHMNLPPPPTSRTRAGARPTARTRPRAGG